MHIWPVMKVLLIFLLYKQITMIALEQMFEAARSIMTWLGECAKVCNNWILIYLYICIARYMQIKMILWLLCG